MSVRSYRGWLVTRDEDGWWAVVFRNWSGVWLSGPFKSSRKAQTAVRKADQEIT